MKKDDITNELWQQERTISKFKLYYEVLNQWLFLKQEKKSLEAYFIKHNYHRIAIYGMGDLGERLYQELEDSNICIAYVIDRSMHAGCQKGIKRYSPDEQFPMTEIDAIIITPVYNYDEIAAMYVYKKVPLVSLTEVVFDVENEVHKVICKPYFVEMKKSYKEIVLDSTASVFDSKEWIETVSGEMEELRQRDPLYCEDRKEWKEVPDHLLPLIPIIEDKLKEQGHIKILDFGGGMGDNFCYLTYGFSEEERKHIDYCIVDGLGNCQRGEQLKLNGKIQFVPNNTVEYKEKLQGKKFDLMILCSTLHYLHPYQEIMRDFAQLGCTYIYITRSMFSPRGETCYLRQKICPSFGKYKRRYLGDMAVSVICMEEFKECMEKAGYKCVQDSFVCKHDPDAYEDYVTVGSPEYHNLIFQQCNV